MADKPSFYITTPIYYVNAAPHLGTAYCTTLCDVMARYKRSMGYDVKFLTGLDEHGEKVQQAAEEHNMTPQAWCDSLAPAFHEIWNTLEISNDDFIRTTEERQIKAVQHLWERILHRDPGRQGRRGASHRGPAPLPRLRPPAGARAGGELVLQAVRLPGQAACPL